MTNRAEIFLLAVFTAGAMLIATPSAYAGDRELRFTQEQLASESGAVAAYDLIVQVSEEVCDETYDGARLVRHRAERERCVLELVTEAVSEAASLQLSAIHARVAL